MDVAQPLQPKLALAPEPTAPRLRQAVTPATAPANGRIAADDPRIPLAAAGDPKAAAALITELLPRVRNLVRYLCRGDADVDDHTQVALLEVLRALPGFQGRSALSTWADRITVRATLRRIKQRRAREAQQATLDDTDALPAPGHGPEHRTLDRRQLAGLLDALPEQQRDALVLHHAVGMSVPEIAEELGLPFDTIKSRLRLATGRLRKLANTPTGSEL